MSGYTQFCFKTMTVVMNGERTPMRIDFDAMMIDVWHHDQQDWIWSDEATTMFAKVLMGSVHGGSHKSAGKG